MKKHEDIDGLTFEDRININKLLNHINGKEVDIFKNVNLDNNKNKILLHSKAIKHRIKRNLYQKHYNNINLVINSKGVSKLIFI